MNYNKNLFKFKIVYVAILPCLFLIENAIGGNTMADVQNILDIVKISNEEYFTLANETIYSFEDKLMAGERFDTLLLKAPTRIDISKHSSFPVLAITQTDGERKWYVQESRNLLAIAYNESTGRIIAKTAHKDKKRRIFPPKDQKVGPLPESVSASAYTTGCRPFDIKFSLDIPWQPSEYRITLICFDWVSNTVDVVLHDGDTKPVTNLTLPQPSDKIVDAILSPAKDASKGNVTFSVPEKCDANPENFTLQGKFSIPVTAHNIVEFKKKKSVVIPAWVMLAEKNIDQGSAVLAKWFITADLPEKNPGRTVAEGIFKLSLSELLPSLADEPLAPNDYCCYVVINGHVFGPEKFSIAE